MSFLDENSLSSYLPWYSFITPFLRAVDNQKNLDAGALFAPRAAFGGPGLGEKPFLAQDLLLCRVEVTQRFLRYQRVVDCRVAFEDDLRFLQEFSSIVNC
jgi:hypothetical protein